MPEMSQECLQADIADQLLLAGLLACFRGRQKTIRVADIIARHYTPVASLSRLYLTRLLHANQIRITSRVDSEALLMDPWKISQAIEIEVIDVARSEYGRVTRRLVSHIKDSLVSDWTSIEKIQEILFEVLSAECIEYADFYCRKEVIELQVYEPDNPRLVLMLQGMSQGQVFMVIWRAVKNLAKELEEADTRVLPFEDVIDLAYEYSIKYNQLDMSIENYNRPKIFKTSRISGILLNDILSIDQDHISYVGIGDYIHGSRVMTAVQGCRI